MPLVKHTSHPAFERLAAEGMSVGDPDPAAPTVRVGLLNLMPDAALAATDRQFFRLLSGHAEHANVHVQPFTVAAEARGAEAQRYVSEYHVPFEELARSRVDALIITGANPAHFELTDEPFWDGLTTVIDWAESETVSTLCSCLATHAVLQHKGMLKRAKLPQKRWGVYEHEDVTTGDRLLTGVSEIVEAPHSHHFDMTRDELEGAGVRVLVHSDEAGVHMATSGDGIRYVFFQGHPEYDDISLLKEYKREIVRYVNGERGDYPPFPDHYFEGSSEALLEQFRHRLVSAIEAGEQLPEFPEERVTRRYTPLWHRQGTQIYANWLQAVGEVAG